MRVLDKLPLHPGDGIAGDTVLCGLIPRSSEASAVVVVTAIVAGAAVVFTVKQYQPAGRSISVGWSSAAAAVLTTGSSSVNDGHQSARRRRRRCVRSSERFTASLSAAMLS